MKTRRVILSTCGTSLLTHGANDETRVFLARTANTSAPKGEDLRRLEAIADERRVSLSGSSLEQASRLSAEINGIVRFYEGDLGRAGSDVHMPLHTDTWQGRATRDLVESWLQSQGLRVQRVPDFADLRAADVTEFKAALPGVVRWCEDTFPGYAREGWHVVFNLTGGFKSINGFLQTLGMFYADEIVYVFESRGDLLRIPRLPVQRDFHAVVEEHFDLFRRLARGLPVSLEMCSSLPEALLTVIDDSVALSEWGELVWERGRGRRYESGLLDLLSPLQATKRFVSDAEKLLPHEPERMRKLNETLEELSGAVGGGHNPRSLRFKSIVGDPRPPSTHECYVWTGDARRIYGHFDGKHFLLDALSDHL